MQLFPPVVRVTVIVRATLPARVSLEPQVQQAAVMMIVKQRVELSIQQVSTCQLILVEPQLYASETYLWGLVVSAHFSYSQARKSAEKFKIITNCSFSFLLPAIAHHYKVLLFLKLSFRSDNALLMISKYCQLFFEVQSLSLTFYFTVHYWIKWFWCPENLKTLYMVDGNSLP